jgi:hypothetical protein
MQESLANAFIGVWRQAMEEQAPAVELEGKSYAVKRTSKHRLRQVDFAADGKEFRALEQNPETASRWAKLAREGKKVMQFLHQGRYLAAVVDGKLIEYDKR